MSTVLFLPLLASAQMISGADYQSVGNEWMQKMMGDSYESYAQEMKGVMGDELFSKMSGAMGKIYQEKENAASRGCWYDDKDWQGFKSMMGGEGGRGWSLLGGFLGAAIIGLLLVGLAIPVALLVLLIVLIVKLIKSLKK